MTCLPGAGVPEGGLLVALRRWSVARGWPSGPWRVLRDGRRLAVLLPGPGVVLRLAPPDGWAVAAREVAVASALAEAGVPAVRLAAVEPQPFLVGGRVATAWEYLEADAARRPSPSDLGRLARRLHDATRGVALDPPCPLVDPLRAIDAALVDAGRAGAPAEAVAFVAGLAEDLGRLWPAAAGDPLGWGLIHADFHAGNVLVTAAGPVLVDFELSGVGPRSYDLIPTIVAVRRYGAPPAAADELAAAYGVDVRRWPGHEALCRIYEGWVTAWALAHADRAPEEAAVRVAALAGRPTRPWKLL